MNLINLNIT